MAYLIEDVVYFIKFGELQFSSTFIQGDLFFSNANRIRAIEAEQQHRGQGDGLENGGRIVSANAWFTDAETGITYQLPKSSNFRIFWELSDKMPLLSLFCVLKEDCKRETDGRMRVVLSKDVRNDIRSHFQKADSGVVIENPNIFISDVIRGIDSEVILDLVKYFHFDGYLREDGIYSNDLTYMIYLATGSTTMLDLTRMLVMSFDAQYSYRALFCKDDFFINEREFRFVLPKITLEVPQVYSIKPSTNMSIIRIEELLSEEGFVLPFSL